MKHTDFSWVKEFPGAITICDPDGVIVEMNDKAEAGFKDDGGRMLIGKNVLDCTPEPARSQLVDMMKTSQRNVYTTERNGVKKIIYQTPWHLNGEYAGFIELSFEIPFKMQHFLRD